MYLCVGGQRAGGVKAAWAGWGYESGKKIYQNGIRPDTDVPYMHSTLLGMVSS